MKKKDKEALKHVGILGLVIGAGVFAVKKGGTVVDKVKTMFKKT